MDKYQKVLWKYGYGGMRFTANERMTTGDVGFQNDTIILKQDENIMINEYTLRISNPTIEAIYIIQNKKETILDWVQEERPMYTMEQNGRRVDIAIDFETPIDALRFVFKNNLADDLIIPICYCKADKEKYYAKKEQERKDSLLKTANIKVSTGADLVNIYFQPCCDEYVRTEITLYKENMLLAKYKVDEETFFKSIGGLAFGKYEFILKQFDDKGTVILETDKISFSLNKPNYGGKPTVYI